MLISELLQQGRAELEKCGVDNAEIDCQLLLGHCLQKSRSQLFLAAAHAVGQSECSLFLSLLRRRKKREPVAYILGEREFWSLPFYVNRDVLIPRPETEFLLETVLRLVQQQKFKIENTVDLCCGSGVIGIVLALELKTKVHALDCSAEALAVTRRNSRLHGVDKLVIPMHSDLFNGLAQSRFSLIVSNPPYVSRGEISGMVEPEVADFEPHLALDGGNDGLDLIRRIVADVLKHLSPNGMFFMEFGAEQGAVIENLFSSAKSGSRFFEKVEIYRDYSDRDRVVYAKANNYSE